MAHLWRGFTLKLVLRVCQGPENVFVLQNAHFREFSLPQIQLMIDPSQKHFLLDLLTKVLYLLEKRRIINVITDIMRHNKKKAEKKEIQ